MVALRRLPIAAEMDPEFALAADDAVLEVGTEPLEADAAALHGEVVDLAPGPEEQGPLNI